MADREKSWHVEKPVSKSTEEASVLRKKSLRAMHPSQSSWLSWQHSYLWCQTRLTSAQQPVTTHDGHNLLQVHWSSAVLSVTHSPPSVVAIQQRWQILKKWVNDLSYQDLQDKLLFIITTTNMGGMLLQSLALLPLNKEVAHVLPGFSPVTPVSSNSLNSWHYYDIKRCVCPGSMTPGIDFSIPRNPEQE